MIVFRINSCMLQFHVLYSGTYWYAHLGVISTNMITSDYKVESGIQFFYAQLGMIRYYFAHFFDLLVPV